LVTFRKKPKKIQIVFYPNHENRSDGKEANFQDLGKCRADDRSPFQEVAGTLDRSASIQSHVASFLFLIRSEINRQSLFPRQWDPSDRA